MFQSGGLETAQNVGVFGCNVATLLTDFCVDQDLQKYALLKSQCRSYLKGRFQRGPMSAAIFSIVTEKLPFTKEHNSEGYRFVYTVV